MLILRLKIKNKKIPQVELRDFYSGVKYGIRTHDLQGHNLAL